MNRLEHGRGLVGHVDVGGCGGADAANDRTGLVGEDVTEEIIGDDHVEAGRVGHQEDRACVGMQVVPSDVRVFGGDLVHDVEPQTTGVDEHVSLVDHGHMLLAAALAGQFEGVAHGALNTETGVHGDLGGHGLFGTAADVAAHARVQAFGAFTHHSEVDLTGVGERGLDAGVQLGGAQVDGLIEREAQLDKQTAFEDTGLDARVADGAEEDRVLLADGLEVLVGQQGAIAQIALGAEIVISELELDFITGGLDEGGLRLGRDLLADAISGDDCDVQNLL